MGHLYTVVEKYMAQSRHIGLQGPFTNLPFDICAIYFDPKVSCCYWISKSKNSKPIDLLWNLS